MLVKIATQVVTGNKENVVGVVQMDTVAEKVGPLEMGVMDHLVVKTTMFAFLGQQVI